jgi:histidine decarboxylase
MGLLLGRNKYPGSTVYSTNGHYSIKKNSIILNMSYVEIKSSSNGEMDYEDLRYHLSMNSAPPIINLTIGTTFDGAIDSVDKTLIILKETSHENFYIHCDAALFGGFLPFLDTTHELDFRKNINSISISTHKFFGIPFPSGIFLSKEKPNGGFVDCIEYIDSDDTTISGSRNGQTAILLWSLIEKNGIEGFKKEASQCIDNAKYLRNLLEGINYNPQLNQNSNTVTFDIPSSKVINKWQLATRGQRAHVVVMQHITKQTIDSLISDISHA